MLTYTHEHREDRSDLSAPMMSIALGIMKTEGNNYAFIRSFRSESGHLVLMCPYEKQRKITEGGTA